MSDRRSARGSSFTRKARNPSAVSAPAQDFALAAAIEDPATPEAFTLAACLPGDVDLLADHFPGREIRMLEPSVLSEHVQAEVRAVLKLATKDGERDGVTIGTTDGRGGWASWHLGFFAPKPGPVPDLPEREQ